jgi:hypothetical protein
MTQPYDPSSTANIDWTSDPIAVNYDEFEPEYQDKVFFVNRGSNFSGEITFTDTNSTNPVYTTVVEIVSVVQSNPKERDNINLSITGADSFSVSGVYWTGWNDQYQFVPPGQTNITSEITIATDNGNCPPGQVLFNLSQDIKDFREKYYNVLLKSVPTTYDGKTTIFDNSIRTIGDVYSKNVSVQQRVVNNYSDITDFIGNYYRN